jgi:hypothetical protein
LVIINKLTYLLYKRFKQQRKGNKMEIKIPVCYIINDKHTGEVVYDFEDMADSLENRISDLLGRNVLITISELKDEY